MSQSDFQRRFSAEERPFAAGSVRGIRSWRPVGALTGACLVGQWGYYWTDGLNRATCEADKRLFLGADRGVRCSGMEPGCTCGFYAYWAQRSDRAQSPIVGVIEGWGKVTIGSKGFRCEKARILAIAPRDLVQDDPHAPAIEALARRYPDAALFPTVEAMLAEFPASDPPEGLPDEPAQPSAFASFTVNWTVAASAFYDAAMRSASLAAAEAAASFQRAFLHVWAPLDAYGVLKAPSEPTHAADRTRSARRRAGSRRTKRLARSRS